MSMTDVRTALAKKLTALALVPATSVAWENIDFTPPKGNKPWLKFTFTPTDPVPATLGQGGTDRVSGFAQVDINVATGSGDTAAMALYQSLYDALKAGVRLTEGQQVVVIESTGRSNGRLVDGYYRVSATINFYADVNR